MLVAVLVVLAVIGVVAAVVTGAVHGDLDEPTSSLAPSGLPEGELSADDVRAVRFSLGFRGYRMDEVDEVLERLTIELAQRDAELDALRAAGVDVAGIHGAGGDGTGADGTGVDAAGADGAGGRDLAAGAADTNGTADTPPTGRHVAEEAVTDRPGRTHHQRGGHEAGAPEGPSGATTARVGPASGGAGWSGPEGG
jgi:DivIVA domain-containing protein